MAQLVSLAQRYIAENRLAGRTPIYSAARFVRLVGDIPTEEIGEPHICRYRTECQRINLSAATIESSIGNIVTVLKHDRIHVTSIGRRLRRNPPSPSPVPLSDLDAIWPHCCGWLRNWIALTSWTALRLSDGMELQAWLGTDLAGDTLRLTASKTRHRHEYPTPRWMPAIWEPVLPPWTRSTDFWRKTLREAIAHACRLAGVPEWTPKQLRQRSVTEWSRANATAGAIVHGCGLGVLHHYLDPLQILEGAAPRVRLPECFGASADAGTEDALLGHFRRLDPAAQGLIAGTAERLAAG